MYLYKLSMNGQKFGQQKWYSKTDTKLDNSCDPKNFIKVSSFSNAFIPGKRTPHLGR